MIIKKRMKAKEDRRKARDDSLIREVEADI